MDAVDRVFFLTSDLTCQAKVVGQLHLDMQSQNYHRIEEEQTGPLVHRLERFGNIPSWVVGAWQKGASKCMACLSLTFSATTRWQSLAWPEVVRHQKRRCFNWDTDAPCQQRRQEPVEDVFGPPKMSLVLLLLCQPRQSISRRRALAKGGGKESPLMRTCPGQRNDARRVCLYCENSNLYIVLSTYIANHMIIDLSLKYMYCSKKMHVCFCPSLRAFVTNLFETQFTRVLHEKFCSIAVWHFD